MNKKLLLSLLCIFSLTACTRPLAGNNNSTTEEETPTSVTVNPGVTSNSSSSATAARSSQTYDLNTKILGQMYGDEGATLYYLTEHLQGTSAYLESIYHGQFSQTQYSELLVSYAVDNPPSDLGKDPTFLFVLDVLTGDLTSSLFVTGDSVELHLLPSPMSTKVFIIQNQLINGVQHSNATIYSCLNGEWSKYSAISGLNTITNEDDSLTSEHLYSFDGNVLIVESQTFSEGSTTPIVQFEGSYQWNTDHSIFQSRT